MKSRNKSQQSQQSKISSTQFTPPKKILFLARESAICAIAEMLFEFEARKMELNWSAASLPLVQGQPSAGFETALALLKKHGVDAHERLEAAKSEATLADLQAFDMVVVLDPSGRADILSEFIPSYPSYKGTVDAWKFSAISDDDVSALFETIKNLMIRLIMQGGRRPAPAPPVEPVRTASEPRGDAKNAVRISRESKGRGGKTVTVITGLCLNPDDLQALATKLKQACGTGGTVKDDTIEIQGDQRDRVMKELQKKGYNPKFSGG